MTRGPGLRAAAVLAAALVLAGCGVPSSATSPGTGATTAPSTSGPVASDLPGNALAAQLLGREFETTGSADVTGYDLVPDSQLTLSFYRDHQNADAFGGSVGCNSMGGTAAWDGDTVRAAEGFARTDMACEGLMDQEDWWAGLLTSGITLALAGDTLTVTAAGGADPVTIRMTDSAVQHPDLPLVGTVWRLDGLIEGDGDSGSVSSVPHGLTASMMLSRDGAGRFRLDVFDGLTWLSAPGGTDGDGGPDDGAVVIEPSDGAVDPADATAGTARVSSGLAGDAAGCPDDDPDCRLDAVRLLGSDFAFTTDRDRLTVKGLGDYEGHGLMFVADPTAPSPDRTAPSPDPTVSSPDRTASSPDPTVSSPDPTVSSPDRTAPSPDSTAPAAVSPLAGHTYRLTKLFTDDGGGDTRYGDARFTITFTATDATADSQCGTIDYPTVRYFARSGVDMVDLGEPTGPACSLGSDPSGVPHGQLMTGCSDDVCYLSTGYVAWYFEPVT